MDSDIFFVSSISEKNSSVVKGCLYDFGGWFLVRKAAGGDAEHALGCLQKRVHRAVGFCRESVPCSLVKAAESFFRNASRPRDDFRDKQMFARIAKKHARIAGGHHNRKGRCRCLGAYGAWSWW